MMVPLRWLLVQLGLAAVVLGSAGRLDVPMVWVLLGVYNAITLVAVHGMAPELRSERFRFCPGAAGEDPWLRLVALPFVIGHLIVAGLDVGRFHWSASMPLAVRVAGVLGGAAGVGMAYWAAAVNPFFSPVVRIQHERGHYLITGGPYGLVRHPGYLGILVAAPSGGLALGSWLSLLPLVGFLVLLFRRTAVEDRFLRKALPGYAEYARRVRDRLLPGLW